MNWRQHDDGGDLELSQLETDIHHYGTMNNEVLLDDLKVRIYW